jgi:hypothetical protein
MLTHKTTFTRTPPTVIIGVAEMAMMLVIQRMVTNGGLDFSMKTTFKAVVGTERRRIPSRVTRLDTARSRRVGACRTATTMVLSGVPRLQNGDEGSRRRIEAKPGTTTETGSLVPKEIVGGKVTMVGIRGNATDTRADGLQTAKMTASSRRRIDLGNLDLVGNLVKIQATAANVAVVDREK